LANKKQIDIRGQMQSLSQKGLRTLLIAIRIISQNEYHQFKEAVNALSPVSKDK
jgi:hypothetical protein